MFKNKSTLNQPNLLAQRISVLGNTQPPRSSVFPFFGKKHQASLNGKRSVVLIHWDARTGAKLARDLQTLGFSVRLESRNPSEAYRSIRTFAPDMVIIDMSINPSQGLAVYQALRYISSTKNIPVIFVGDQEVNLESANAHFIDPSQMPSMIPQVVESIFTKPLEN
ncbi:MAG: hypothetical protein KA140_04360 [Caldisericia bacterium]|nr:hypothetical protein [Caldisericia bacterium]